MNTTVLFGGANLFFFFRRELTDEAQILIPKIKPDGFLPEYA